MGRGPSVRAASASAMQIDFRYHGVRCREKLRLALEGQGIRRVIVHTQSIALLGASGETGNRR